MQLMIALLLKSILWIVIVGPEISSKIRDYRRWGWTCNFVISAHFYTQLVAICWALVLGHYLLGRLNSVQSCIEFLKLRYMSFCWGIPGLIISLWATMMALSNDTICWEYHSKSRYFWIITTPMLAAFGAELFYLVNIIRTIIRRYQNVQTRNELLRIQKAKRDVGIFSIFAGFNNVLLLCNPWGEANESYRIFQAFFQSIQGGIIALLCCFTYYRTLLKKLNRPDLSRRPESFLVQFQQNFMTERNI
ncbi:unnamed protein product [Allacma fusca]|nr:unnamed protein product [Allacma fusca]